ncbi:MAG: 2-amino-4-hydroxy-6-hydroxymethyldihydropteridine diphosphokinase [Bacteroidetes bacterium]|nr:2-amino-4-hydroxy-6-hydroxymethyldihydropteridine diphosphokinase [Bacteroidota bacterium]MDA0879695.1 2-amino-4-hydroxy-6-hydroxymethyldihydropteridine diphosphokinase [Bacteroidota bacterium]MDA1115330.1 2-amino-4-hydroxy-6-hydroxymethyldihydropteridine diphosphokinase [Bacteroidota bacterium]
MESKHTYYIALGSNLGDRYASLQSAVEFCFLEIGPIEKLSRIYECEAQGFVGPSFYNACIALQSMLSPKQVLDKLLLFEIQEGRQRNRENYTSRSIDLDILMVDDLVVENKNLIVPHPKMHLRDFVLRPLSDIAPELVHPKLDCSTKELLSQLAQTSNLELVNLWLKNPSDRYAMPDGQYLAIEGNIGAGKTSLAQLISTEFNAHLVLERFSENPFLPRFYKNPKRYAFSLEMSFLAERYQQINDDLSQLDLFSRFVVSDYFVFKSLIFSKVTLSEDEFSLYRKLFDILYKDTPKPDLYVYLHQSIDQLKLNIENRGREYESSIQADYLQCINDSYLEYLRTQQSFPVKIIDLTGIDFVNNRQDYLKILKEIKGL